MESSLVFGQLDFDDVDYDLVSECARYLDWSQMNQLIAEATRQVGLRPSPPARPRVTAETAAEMLMPLLVRAIQRFLEDNPHISLLRHSQADLSSGDAIPLLA